MGKFHDGWMTAFLVSLAGLVFFQNQGQQALVLFILFLLLIPNRLDKARLAWICLGFFFALFAQARRGMDLEARDLWGREEVVRFKLLDLDDWGDEREFTIAIPGADLGRPFHGPYRFLLSSRKIKPSDLGGQFQASLTFQPFSKTQLAGSFSWGDWQEGEGVSGQLRGRKFKKTGQNFFSGLKYRIRHWLGRGLDRLPKPAGPFIKRVFLGASVPMDPDLKAQIQGLGLAHLLAASGLHVNILFHWGLDFLSVFLPKRSWADRVLFFFLFVYAWILNFPPPIYRALVFLLFQDLALFFNLKVDKKKRWLFALTSYLFFRPYALKNKGLQLSFLCTLSLDLAQKLDQKRPLMSPVFQKIRVSFWISLLTLPIMASLQSSFPPIVFLANLLAIPFFNFLFRLGLVTSLLFPLPFLGAGLAKLLTWAFQAFLFLLSGLNRLAPEGVDLAPFYRSGSLFAYYGLLCLLGLVYKTRPFFKNQDITGRALLRKLNWQAQWAWVLACLLAIVQPLFLRFRPAQLTMVDVGQGDCFLVQSGGHAVLLDTGGVRDWQTGENKQGEGLAAYLKNLRVAYLDGVFISHSDYDHMGNLKTLAGSIPIQKIYSPAWQDKAIPGKIFGPLADRVHPVKRGESYLAPDQGFAIKVLIPGRLDGEDPNNQGMVVLVTLSPAGLVGHPLRVLFTGDREEGEEELIQILQEGAGADILKVPHHGADQGTSVEFLQAMAPERALISVGLANPYGHPSAGLLNRLRNLGIPVHRTDLEGTVVIQPRLFLFPERQIRKGQNRVHPNLPGKDLSSWEIRRLDDLKRDQALAWMALGLVWAYTIKKTPWPGRLGA